jgi:hypothetical protein
MFVIWGSDLLLEPISPPSGFFSIWSNTFPQNIADFSPSCRLDSQSSSWYCFHMTLLESPCNLRLRNWIDVKAISFDEFATLMIWHNRRCPFELILASRLFIWWHNKSSGWDLFSIFKLYIGVKSASYLLFYSVLIRFYQFNLI